MATDYQRRLDQSRAQDLENILELLQTAVMIENRSQEVYVRIRDDLRESQKWIRLAIARYRIASP